MVSLGVAMGIGRFAFTPILPMMLADGVVDLAAASWLASANYLGYLVGALLCTLQPWLWTRIPRLPALAYWQLVRGGLLMTGVLTLAMAWLDAPAWPLLRFLAGVTSGVVFVYTSGWCLSRLASLGVPAMGGFIYMGPGAGIVLSGLAASGMVAAHWTAASAGMAFFARR
jgi:MFS family permease